jgi:hypothetical protein
MALQPNNFRKKCGRQDYIRAHSSFISKFVEALFIQQREKSKRERGYSIPRMVVYSSYVHYCKHLKIEPFGRQGFGKYFCAYSQAKGNTSNGESIYYGVKWRSGEALCQNPAYLECKAACKCEPCLVCLCLSFSLFICT